MVPGTNSTLSLINYKLFCDNPDPLQYQHSVSVIEIYFIRNLGIILTLLILTSCNNGNVAKSSSLNDSLSVDSKYVKGTWISYFRTFKTPLGKTINFKIINDSCYVIQWGNSLNLKTFPDTLKLDGHEAWIPRYITENKDYIVLRQGCGNPCWVGYFLTLNDSINPQYIHEYLDFDLKNNLVVYIKDNENIGIVNIKTGLTEDYKTKKCGSIFPGYCIDIISLKNKTLKYIWYPKTKYGSKKGILITEKIKI